MTDLIQIHISYRTRAKCCFCPSICFVHSCSDGHFRCDSCAEKSIKDGLGEYGGSPSVPADHDHQLEEYKELLKSRGERWYQENYLNPFI